MLAALTPLRSWLLIGLVVALTACGQVLTVEPSPSPSPSPTVALEPLSISTPTGAPTRAVFPLATDPPPSPVPTPTPIVYRVEPGDTLLGIAVLHNVTAAAIQSANPGLRPELLQIGQQVIIPLSEGGATGGGQLLPTLEPLPLAVGGFGLYETPVGGLMGLGDVVNATEFPAENVHLLVALYDEAGELVASLETWAARDLILPGETSPFGVLFSEPPAGPLTPLASVLSAEKAVQDRERYADLRVDQEQGGLAGSIYRVTGTVSNVGDRATPEVSLVVTLYDADEQVVGFREMILSGPVLPGATVDYDVRLSPVGLGADHHVVSAGGRAVDVVE